MPKLQMQCMGELVHVVHFAVENINDVRFINVIVKDVDPRKLRSMADWISKQWGSCIVAIVAQ